MHPPLAIIGGGNMAHAIYSGALRAGVLDPSRVVVADPDPAKRAAFTHARPTAPQAIDWLDAQSEPGQIMLAIKPQSLPALATELKARLHTHVLISILAGTPGASLRTHLGASLRIIRVMPNTPARIGRGMTAVALSAGASPGDDAFAQTLFAAIGAVVTIGESQMNAFTAIAGSGPAYLFYLAEAMQSAAADMGLDAPTAALAVRETLAGASLLLAADASPPASLRAAVTSKRGTTAAATDALDASGVMEAIKRAVLAARDRGDELAREMN